MSARLLLILVFLWQPLALASTVVRWGENAPDACCVMIKVVSCCGTDSTEMSVCAKTGGECRCGVKTNADPRPLPMAPAPRADRDATPVAPAARVVSAFAIDARSSARSTRVDHGYGRIALRHNEAQALLGVWRT